MSVPWGMHRCGQCRSSAHKRGNILLHRTFLQSAIQTFDKQCSRSIERPAQRARQQHAWLTPDDICLQFEPNIAVYLKKKKETSIRESSSLFSFWMNWPTYCVSLIEMMMMMSKSEVILERQFWSRACCLGHAIHSQKYQKSVFKCGVQ